MPTSKKTSKSNTAPPRSRGSNPTAPRRTRAVLDDALQTNDIVAQQPLA